MLENQSHGVDPNKLKGPDQAAAHEQAAVRALVIGNAVRLAAGELSPQFMNTIITEAFGRPMEPTPQASSAAHQPYTTTPKFQAAPAPNTPSVSNEGAGYDDFMTSDASGDEYLRVTPEEPAAQPAWQKPMTSEAQAMADKARMLADQARDNQDLAA